MLCGGSVGRGGRDEETPPRPTGVAGAFGFDRVRVVRWAAAATSRGHTSFPRDEDVSGLPSGQPSNARPRRGAEPQGPERTSRGSGPSGLPHSALHERDGVSGGRASREKRGGRVTGERAVARASPARQPAVPAQEAPRAGAGHLGRGGGRRGGPCSSKHPPAPGASPCSGLSFPLRLPAPLGLIAGDDSERASPARAGFHLRQTKQAGARALIRGVPGAGIKGAGSPSGF